MHGPRLLPPRGRSARHRHPPSVRTRVADGIALPTEIGGRGPDAVRGAKRLMNRLASVGAAAQFAAERAEIGAVVGTRIRSKR